MIKLNLLEKHQENLIFHIALFKVGFKKEELYKNSESLSSSLRLNPGGRKSDTADYDHISLAFIKEARSHEIAITSTEVINKAIEIVLDFKEKSYNSMHK